jgi:hypothetical protein
MFSGSSSLKFYKRIGIYKNSTGTCEFDPENIQGRSYRWTFCAPINGIVVFNEYHWSQTTSCHQSAVSSVLSELKIPYVRGNFGRNDMRGFDGRAAATELFKELAELEIKLEQSRKPDGWTYKSNVSRAAEIHADLEKLARLDKRFRVPEKTKKTIRAEAELSELERVSELESEKCFKHMELKRASENLSEINF